MGECENGGLGWGLSIIGSRKLNEYSVLKAECVLVGNGSIRRGG